MSIYTAINTVAFEITERCNLSCEFCIRSARHGPSRSVEPDQFAAWIEIISRAFPDLQLIAITGGEPFLHSRLPDLVKIAAKAGTRICITTNATRIPRNDLAEYAQNKRLHFIISIDGPDAATHDGLRGQTGVFDQSMKFVEVCRRLQIPFCVNMTVGERNYRQVYDTVLLARAIGARDISVGLVKPHGRGKLITDGQVVLADVGRQVMRAKGECEPSLKVLFTDPLAHIFDPSLAQPGLRGGCGAGSGTLHIQCDGNVLICTACTESLGNIDEIGPTLAERVYADARIRAVEARSTLGGACGACAFLQACGGCRCRATATEEGFLGPDPQCPKNINRVDPGEIAAVDDIREHFPAALQEYFDDWSLEKTAQILVLRKWLQSGVIKSNRGKSKILAVAGSGSVEKVLALAALGFCLEVPKPVHPKEHAEGLLAAQRFLPLRVLDASIHELKGVESTGYDVVYLTGSFPYLVLLHELCIALDQLSDRGHILIELKTVGDGAEAYESSGSPRHNWAKLQSDRTDLLEMLNAVGFQRVQVIDFDQNGWFCVSGERLAS